MDIPTLPLENVILVTAFGKQSNRVKKQAVIEFSIGKDLFEVNFFISPQLINDAILGCQFMKENEVSLNFERETFSYVKEGLVKEQQFYQPAATLEVGCSDRHSRDTNALTCSYSGQYPVIIPADCNLSVSLLETCDQLNPSLLRSALMELR
jgi:hypothetical protein